MCGCSVIVGDDSAVESGSKKLMQDFDSSQRTEKKKIGGSYPLVPRCKKSGYNSHTERTVSVYQRKLILFLDNNSI